MDSGLSIYPSSNFPFTKVLEEHWQEIYAEYLGVQDSLVDYVERDLYDQGWKVFIMANFPHREVIHGNDVRCPFTMSLIKRHVPRPGVVCFSLLMPQTRIEPHEGFKGQYLRCHLGLKVPSGDCRLSLNGESKAWANGKTIVFDDRFRHGAWNLTDEPRVVLLFDFIP